MLAYMEEKYRYVFIDSPPLSLVSDGENWKSLRWCHPGCAWGCDIKAFGEEFDSPVREGGLPAVRIVLKPWKGKNPVIIPNAMEVSIMAANIINDAYYYGNH